MPALNNALITALHCTDDHNWSVLQCFLSTTILCHWDWLRGKWRPRPCKASSLVSHTEGIMANSHHCTVRPTELNLPLQCFPLTTKLQCTAVHWPALHGPVMHWTSLHCNTHAVLQCIALHFTSLHCIALCHQLTLIGKLLLTEGKTQVTISWHYWQTESHQLPCQHPTN